MFTVLAAVGAIASIGWFSHIGNRKDIDHVSAPSDEFRRSVFHAVHGIKLITVMLGAILIMLGIIADRLP